jgi:hypothetical protein
MLYAGYVLAVVFFLIAIAYRHLLKQTEGYAKGMLVAYDSLLSRPPSMLTDLQIVTLARVLQNTQIALQTKEN